MYDYEAVEQVTGGIHYERTTGPIVVESIDVAPCRERQPSASSSHATATKQAAFHSATTSDKAVRVYMLLMDRSHLGPVRCFPTASRLFVFYRYAVSTMWERQVSEGTASRDFHSYFCCCAKRIGHMFALISHPDGTPIVLAGPCWPFCVLVTLPLIVGTSSLVAYYLVISDTFSLVSATYARRRVSRILA
jgi:hypothetical protein